MTENEKMAYYRQQLNKISVLVRVMACYDCQIERLINNKNLPPFEIGLRDFIEDKVPLAKKES